MCHGTKLHIGLADRVSHHDFMVLIAFHFLKKVQIQFEVVHMLDLVETSIAPHDDDASGAGLKPRLQRLRQERLPLVGNLKLSKRIELHLERLPPKNGGIPTGCVRLFRTTALGTCLKTFKWHLRKRNPGQSAVIHSNDQTFHISTIRQCISAVSIQQNAQPGQGSRFWLPIHCGIARVRSAARQICEHRVDPTSQRRIVACKIDTQAPALLITGAIAHAQIHLDGKGGDRLTLR